MLLIRIIRPAVGARTKDSRAPLSMFSAPTIRRMLQDPTTRATEAVRVYRRKHSLKLRIRQQQLASKFHCPPRKRFDAKGIREELANTVCSWWFIWRMTSLYDSKNYDGGLNGRDYSRVLWGVLCTTWHAVTLPHLSRMKRITYIYYIKMRATHWIEIYAVIVFARVW